LGSDGIKKGRFPSIVSVGDTWRGSQPREFCDLKSLQKVSEMYEWNGIKVKEAKMIIDNGRNGPLRCIGMGKSEKAWMGAWCLWGSLWKLEQHERPWLQQGCGNNYVCQCIYQQQSCISSSCFILCRLSQKKIMVAGEKREWVVNKMRENLWDKIMFGAPCFLILSLHIFSHVSLLWPFINFPTVSLAIYYKENVFFFLFLASREGKRGCHRKAYFASTRFRVQTICC